MRAPAVSDGHQVKIAAIVGESHDRAAATAVQLEGLRQRLNQQRTVMREERERGASSREIVQVRGRKARLRRA